MWQEFRKYDRHTLRVQRNLKEGMNLADVIVSLHLAGLSVNEVRMVMWQVKMGGVG